MNLFDRINIAQIFKRHFDTLYDHGELTFNGKHKMPFADRFTFFYFPLFISFVLVVPLHLFINESYLNIVITALSIFVGLLFGLLTLVLDIVKTEKNIVQKPDVTHIQKMKFKLVKELFINIAFAIALSIISIIAALLTRFHSTEIARLIREKTCYYTLLKHFYLYATNMLALFLIFLFVATLLMILKRFFIIFSNDFDDAASEVR